MIERILSGLPTVFLSLGIALLIVVIISACVALIVNKPTRILGIILSIIFGILGLLIGGYTVGE